jgi:hypothetical protein
MLKAIVVILFVVLMGIQAKSCFISSGLVLKVLTK